MQTVRFIAIFVFVLSLCSCRQQAANVNGNTLKVKISKEGEIAVNGQIVSVDQLSEKLAELKRANGMLLYFRENPQDDPHPNALKVINLVADNQLPIRLCAKADFSDSVDEKTSYAPRR